jgi:A/G-specific adenine glycosylase
MVAALLTWYRGAARDLPWRGTSDPYAIWVSEVMLQQTRVDTVVPYYERFVRRWPTVGTLAAASIDDVLQAWSGLGYYRRARQLHAAATEVVDQHGGKFPSTAAGLAGLTGIGRYTSGAIASIAFGEAAPVVDGNVIRVLSRVYELRDDMRSSRGQKQVWARAEELVPDGAPGDFNQALMELGATICRPRKADCDACPIRPSCRAYARGTVDELPIMAKRKAPKPVRLLAAVVWRGEALLVGQREADGLFGGMWEPPMVPDGESAEAGLAACGIGPLSCLEMVGRLKHQLSHRTMDVAVASGRFRARSRLPPPTSPYVRLAWRKPAEVALSTLAQKVVALASGAPT